MAKYTVMMSCGHEQTVELLGRDSDRQKKIRYFQESGMCKECYKKMMDLENRKMGLLVHVAVLPSISPETGEILLSIWFDGDTITHKDEIKSLCYYWDYSPAPEDLLSSSSKKYWSKTICESDLSAELAKAEAIGAIKAYTETELFAAFNYRVAMELKAEWQARQAKINDIPRPKVPEVLLGHRWNQKIYGKAGNYSVYPDGKKVSITDDQASEIKRYIKEKTEYKKAIEEIGNK